MTDIYIMEKIWAKFTQFHLIKSHIFSIVSVDCRKKMLHKMDLFGRNNLTEGTRFLRQALWEGSFK